MGTRTAPLRPSTRALHLRPPVPMGSRLRWATAKSEPLGEFLAPLSRSLACLHLSPCHGAPSRRLSSEAPPRQADSAVPGGPLRPRHCPIRFRPSDHDPKAQVHRTPSQYRSTAVSRSRFSKETPDFIKIKPQSIPVEARPCFYLLNPVFRKIIADRSYHLQKVISFTF